MKRNFSLFSTAYTVLAAAFFALACSPFPEAKPGRHFQITWPNADGEYELQRVQIDTFTEPRKLKGPAATLIVEPRVGDSGLEGESAVGRFIETSDGTLVPADFVTHQSVVVYAHMERLKKLDEILGVGGDEFVWPAHVGLRANVIDSQGPLQNNAVYDGLLNALLLVPYTDTGLPITLNGGVLAHEHFHAIFQLRVLSRLGTVWQDVEAAEDSLLHVCGLDENEPDVLRVTRSFAVGSKGDKAAREVTKLEYNRFLARGLNEGLADYWGWIYSNDTTFIRKSLRTAGSVRDLGQDMDPLPGALTIRSSLRRLSNPRARSALSYTFGSHYARFLRRLVEEQVKTASLGKAEAQREVARALVKALPKIADAFEAGFEREFIAPDVALKPLIESLATVNAGTCRVYEDFIGSNNAGTKLRPDACPAVPPQPAPVTAAAPSSEAAETAVEP